MGGASTDGSSKHFVFVHGACHGAWCWYKTVDRLQRSGHRTTALDLPSAGRDNADPATISTMPLLARPLDEFFQALRESERVILVAHSMGGLVLPYIMERFPQKISAAVFVAAFMLPSGYVGRETMVKVFTSIAGLMSRLLCKKEEGSFTTSCVSTIYISASERNYFYNLSSLEDVVLSDSLRKPFPLLPVSEMAVDQTPENFGSVPRIFIRCLNDLALPAEATDHFIQIDPPTEVISLNCDHSPFFSDVERLHCCLLDIAAKHA